MASQPHQSLKRQLGIPGAIALGLGSIVGTGVFVSIGLAAGIAGPAMLIAVAIGALVATCNGLNSAQLATNHPVSGGAYEYGYRYLNPWLGFTAGWMFLIAKSASAATAALGFAGYVLNLFGLSDRSLLVPTALGAVVILTGLILTGIKRSNVINIGIVSVTIFSLVFFVLAGLPLAIAEGATNFTPFFQSGTEGGTNTAIGSVFHAAALMFVAYTGYGRIATLGEEIREPRRTIPRAMITTLIITMLLYTGVAVVGIGSVGADTLGSVTRQEVAPLEVAARNFAVPGSSIIMAVGAVTATLGVLLNLILGLSRVLFAMGRRRDLPRVVARLNQSTTPYIAVIIMGVAIAAIVLIGDVRITWSFSAFTVLVYYALTDLSALQIPDSDRLYPRWIAWVGLCACLFLAFWVEQQIWLMGLGLIAVGLVWRWVMQNLSAYSAED
ncbi:amino acid permease [Chlorogloeopsis sp. ULAP01]|uniref:APC family permease n=1 Tax=Chlorogloeopsis sp. ULAP01 TaxID=3056483 RepID=UPI0025AA42D5|nr:amino acid permease [Chlorogloeopsis sp. ULAP01]MDM9379563.1 amino acid permease [Chlorogloeopsis sp. ULAP01]